MKRAKVEMPTDAEEAVIQRGIARDPDNPEWTAAETETAKPASEILPPGVYAGLVRRRGPSRRPAKEIVSFRLPPDTAAKLRATGPGWQTRAGELLAKYAEIPPSHSAQALAVLDGLGQPSGGSKQHGLAGTIGSNEPEDQLRSAAPGEAEPRTQGTAGRISGAKALAQARGAKERIGKLDKA